MQTIAICSYFENKVYDGTGLCGGYKEFLYIGVNNKVEMKTPMYHFENEEAAADFP